MNSWRTSLWRELLCIILHFFNSEQSIIHLNIQKIKTTKNINMHFEIIPTVCHWAREIRNKYIIYRKGNKLVLKHMKKGLTWFIMTEKILNLYWKGNSSSKISKICLITLFCNALVKEMLSYMASKGIDQYNYLDSNLFTTKNIRMYGVPQTNVTNITILEPGISPGAHIQSLRTSILLIIPHEIGSRSPACFTCHFQKEIHRKERILEMISLSATRSASWQIGKVLKVYSNIAIN